METFFSIEQIHKRFWRKRIISHDFTNYKIRLFFLGYLLFFSACRTAPSSNKITIATAANMQFAMEALTKAFTAQTDIGCDIVMSSSGKLTAQIKEGAPYDVFVAANMRYPNELFDNGFTTTQPQIYAYGYLALWSMIEGLNPSLEGLKSDAVQHIALANTQTAPYGMAAMDVLRCHELDKKLTEKLVYGESIAQTNQFIHSKSAEVGFTALSVVLSPPMKNKGRWVKLEEGYAPIEQGVVLIRRAEEDLALAGRFYVFLFSAEAKQILEDFGYLVNE